MEASTVLGLVGGGLQALGLVVAAGTAVRQTRVVRRELERVDEARVPVSKEVSPLYNIEPAQPPLIQERVDALERRAIADEEIVRKLRAELARVKEGGASERVQGERFVYATLHRLFTARGALTGLGLVVLGVLLQTAAFFA